MTQHTNTGRPATTLHCPVRALQPRALQLKDAPVCMQRQVLKLVALVSSSQLKALELCQKRVLVVVVCRSQAPAVRLYLVVPKSACFTLQQPAPTPASSIPSARAIERLLRSPAGCMYLVCITQSWCLSLGLFCHLTVFLHLCLLHSQTCMFCDCAQQSQPLTIHLRIATPLAL